MMKTGVLREPSSSRSLRKGWFRSRLLTTGKFLYCLGGTCSAAPSAGLITLLQSIIRALLISHYITVNLCQASARGSEWVRVRERGRGDEGEVSYFKDINNIKSIDGFGVLSDCHLSDNNHRPDDLLWSDQYDR
jgi:hypothetical protein